MSEKNKPPLIGISGCRSGDAIHPYNRVGEKYLHAVVDPIGGTPIVLPVLSENVQQLDYSVYIDGLLLTGSSSNVTPSEYGGQPSAEGTKHDVARDKTMIPLINRCLDKGIPILGLCLGIQELNVACGGTLHQRIFDLENKFDHRMRRDIDDHEKRYRPAYNIKITEGGLLSRITNVAEANVNSLHAQGIDRLGKGLQVEAAAPDGIIEAVSAENSEAFALGVQWHPEWPRPIDPFNVKIFNAFGEYCRRYAETK
ncbi:MAG: gamma-glutamyl-gamma-aminobutyrate hydrolase [Rhodospirillaceae bacterium]|nr:gamma-glutamyl-gamma-aminobutyrate hydrolase [Rhodospirillaceae bacterium]